MRKLISAVGICVFTVLTVLLSCGYLMFKHNPWFLLAAVPGFLIANILAGLFGRKLFSRRLKICRHGVVALKVFLCSAVVAVVYHVWLMFYLLPGRHWELIISIVICVCAEAVLFWNGMLSMYFSSAQLRIKYRVRGLLCGFIPVANIVMLIKMVSTADREVTEETDRELLERSREAEQVCATKYPLLLVHGVFFRDSKLLNYWGRIPKTLERNGAKVYYGQHQSAASVADSAAELTERIKEIVHETGCEKVNIIAHSKGGLDCRYALKHTGVSEYVASLTTVNTPHRGCKFADWLLEKVPQAVKTAVASVYNAAAGKLGDTDPDFMAAVTDLTAAACKKFDSELTVPRSVFCQSVGSCISKAANGQFPLNYSYRLVKFFDGPNDGLVAADSFRFGDRYIYLEPTGDRGISHGDVIDLNRENIKGFDVREFYVELVSDLKKRGL